MSVGGGGALSTEMQSYPLGLQLDAVSTYRNLPAFVGQDGYLQVYPDPVVESFLDPNQTRIVNGTHEYVAFRVSQSRINNII